MTFWRPRKFKLTSSFHAEKDSDSLIGRAIAIARVAPATSFENIFCVFFVFLFIQILKKKDIPFVSRNSYRYISSTWSSVNIT
jgi:hypothetical protein